MPKKKASPSAGILDCIPETMRADIQELLDSGWTYSKAKEKGGGTAFLLTNGDDTRIRLSMGVTTEGGQLRAFINMNQPEMIVERKDERGIWRALDPDDLASDDDETK